MDLKHEFVQLTSDLLVWCRSYLGLQRLSEKTKEQYLEELDHIFKNPVLTQTLYNKYHTKGGRYRAILKLILDTLEDKGYSYYKYRKMKYKKTPPKKPRIWTKEQILRMAREIEEFGLLIECAYYIGGGLRFSSAIMLKWTDFQWEEWIQNPENAGKCNIYAKGDRDDYLDVAPYLMTKLYNIARKEGKTFQGIPYRNFAGNLYMFFDEKELESIKTRIKKEEFNKTIDLPEDERFPVDINLKARNELIERYHKRVDYRLLKLKKSFDNNKIKFHSIRHSRAMHLLDMGFDITEIKEMLMHKNISTTQIYVNATKQKITSKFNNMLKNEGTNTLT